MSIRLHGLQKERVERWLMDMDENDLLDQYGSGAPTNGVTGAGTAGIGCIYHDTDGGGIWTNEGTKASPVWIDASETY